MSRAGTVALVGRPNVGKSTLMNALLGEDLSIVSPKAQTTRHRVIGVLTEGDAQLLLLDTPGQADRRGKAMNRLLDRTATAAMADVDIVLWLVDARQWTAADAAVQRRLEQNRPRVLGLIFNKVDRLRDKAELLPRIGELNAAIAPDFTVPLSATRRDNLAALREELHRHLPEGPWFYDADTLTPHPAEFLVAEQVREQLFRRLHQELPYEITVTVDRLEDRGRDLHADATIWINQASHKSMVIGRGGQTLKAVGQEARGRLSALFGRPVHLKLWVKLRRGWADNEDSLRAFGYGVTE